MLVNYTLNKFFIAFQLSVTKKMTYFHVKTSPHSPQNSKIGHVIQTGKGGWVTLCFECDTIWRFKLHNLERVPASDRTHTDDLVKPNWNSRTHSVRVLMREDWRRKNMLKKASRRAPLQRLQLHQVQLCQSRRIHPVQIHCAYPVLQRRNMEIP